MDKDNSAHNHWFRIAQTQKIGILHEADSKEHACNEKGQQSTPASPMASTHHAIVSIH